MGECVYQARKEMLKLKSVVKLQAAVRGHLVRNHAAGTLHCVKAIIKLQALFRARRARLLSEGSCTEEKLNWNHVSDNPNSKMLILYLGQQTVGLLVVMFKCLTRDHATAVNLRQHSLSNSVHSTMMMTNSQEYLLCSTY